MTVLTSVFEQFAAQAVRRRDAVLFDLPDGGVRTYGQTLDVVGQIAARLVSDGVIAGDRVAVQVDKSPEAIMTYLATQQIGAVFLPLNTAYTGREVNYFLDDASPRVLICAPERRAEFADRDLVVETLGADGTGTLVDRQTRYHDVEPVDADTPAAILYTSGTTGRSKGAVLTHGNLASNCAALREIWRYTIDDRLIHALPIFHVHGLFVAAHLVLTTGSRMHFLPGFDVEAILDLLPDSSVLMGVPTYYTRLLGSDRLTPELCAGMRLFVSGSAPLLASDHDAFAARTGHRILERYGMTETGMNTSNPYDGDRRAGTVGLPLPDVDLRVVDRQTGAELAPGEIGSVQVRGPNVFAGYWNMPEKTASEFCDDGFFITGDVGVLSEDGYLTIVGRDKDMVISGGFNVYPVEIEALIDEHPDVVESAVIGAGHPDLGEGVVAVVVPAAGRTLTSDDVLACVADRLARFKQPRAVRFVDALPRNVMGKVQKAQLREQFADVFARGTRAT